MRYLLIGLAGFLFSTVSISQDSVVVRDFETWSGVSLRTSFLDKKLDLKWTNEIRLVDNSTERDIFFTELDLSYEIFKNFKAGGAFRYINETENTGKNQYRYQFDLDYRHKIKRFDLGYRIRYQNRDYFAGGAGNGDFGTSKYRFKFELGYNIKKWKLDPYFSAEVFYVSTTENAIQYIDEVETGTLSLSGFEKMRYTIGTEYKLVKNLDLGLFYRIEQGLGSFPSIYGDFTPAPKTSHIVGINLSYKLAKKKD